MFLFKTSKPIQFILITIIIWLITYAISCHLITDYLNSTIINGQISFTEIFTSILFYEENYPIFLSFFLPFAFPTLIINLSVLVKLLWL